MPTSNTHLFLTAPLRHRALTARNPLAHNAFIYSVTTTKIYCRPTCPSRLARRSNIIFHDNPAQAAAEGFRACKRCRPDCDGEDAQIAMCERVCGLIRGEIESRSEREVAQERGGRKWSVKGLAREVGITESHFCRVFKKITGMTVGEYKRMICMEATIGKVSEEDDRSLDIDTSALLMDSASSSETSHAGDEDDFERVITEKDTEKGFTAYCAIDAPAYVDFFRYIDFDAEVFSHDSSIHAI